MLAPITRRYLLAALEGTPDVLRNLLSGIAADSPVWDVHPDPDRFSLREVLAHLADAETNWKVRAIRTRDEDEPYFAARSIDAAHSGRDPLESLAQYRADRAAYVETLRGLSDPVWERRAQSQLLGSISIEDQAVFVLTHDGYHTQQIARWVEQSHRAIDS